MHYTYVRNVLLNVLNTNSASSQEFIYLHQFLIPLSLTSSPPAQQKNLNCLCERRIWKTISRLKGDFLDWKMRRFDRGDLYKGKSF